MVIPYRVWAWGAGCRYQVCGVASLSVWIGGRFGRGRCWGRGISGVYRDTFSEDGSRLGGEGGE